MYTLVSKTTPHRITFSLVRVNRLLGLMDFFVFVYTFMLDYLCFEASLADAICVCGANCTIEYSKPQLCWNNSCLASV